jgi:hypothetical protein
MNLLSFNHEQYVFITRFPLLLTILVGHVKNALSVRFILLRPSLFDELPTDSLPITPDGIFIVTGHIGIRDDFREFGEGGLLGFHGKRKDGPSNVNSGDRIDRECPMCSIWTNQASRFFDRS